MAAGTSLAACTPINRTIGGPVDVVLPAVPERLSMTDFKILSRLTFGPRMVERQQTASIGLYAWIEEQLAPHSIDDTPLEWRLHGFDLLDFDAATLASMGDLLFDDLDPARVVLPFQQATLLRQVYSRRQLYESMVAFWSDHFNISVSKGDCWFLKVVDDREVIRPNALGNFRELLRASAKSPAMLVYLDNQANLASAPNENYAREVMELHTLGVSGGYTQTDVMELARCLTGWSVKDHFWRGEFTFNPDVHDWGEKRVLGLSLPKADRPFNDRIQAGLAETEDTLDLLARHPATARRVAEKLARRFIADEPSEQVVARAAQVFLESDGDIKSVLRSVLFDGLIEMRTALPKKYKPPITFITSALRMLDAETNAGPSVIEAARRMGLAPFEWPTPDGPPDRAADWQGNLLPRWQFALAYARDELEGTRLNGATRLEGYPDLSPEATIDRISPLLLGQTLPKRLTDEFGAALRRTSGIEPAELTAVVVAGLIGSPAFQWS